MSIETATAFREFLNTNTDAQAEVKAAIASGGDLSAVGAKHGFEFSHADIRDVLKQAEASGQLSELEMEKVAGGEGPLSCNQTLLQVALADLEVQNTPP